LPTLYYGPRRCGQSKLLGFAVFAVLPAPRAELLQREPIGIVSLVFFAVVIALLTLDARQRNEHSISLLGHFLATCLYRLKLATGAQGED
jgi:hypothetical protein